MRSSEFSQSPFASHDPVRAAEDDIRRYLIRCGVITPPKTESCEPQTALCLMGIYIAIALVTLLGWFVLSRLECDPLFSDRGWAVACRNRPGELSKVASPTANPYSGFMPANMQP